jgi:hypothetical protein
LIGQSQLLVVLKTAGETGDFLVAHHVDVPTNLTDEVLIVRHDDQPATELFELHTHMYTHKVEELA